MNLTNNRLENLNQKFKSVCTRYTNLKTSFDKILAVIASLRTERDFRFAMITEKIPVRTIDNNIKEYQTLVTPFALKYVLEQYECSSKYNLDNSNFNGRLYQSKNKNTNTKTTESKCNCIFFKSIVLPCRHIFAVRTHIGSNLYDPSLIKTRWLLSVYKTNICKISLNNRSTVEQRKTSPTVISVCIKTDHRKLTQGTKYKRAKEICSEIASSVSLIGSRHFNHYINLLQDVKDAIDLQKDFAGGEQNITNSTKDLKECKPPDISIQSPSSTICFQVENRIEVENIAQNCTQEQLDKEPC